MRGLSLLLLLGVFGAVVALGAQNDEGVTLTFLAWSVTASMWMVVAAGYLLGMLSGWALAGVLRRSWRRVAEPARA
ncbi:MAG: hypothetical protein JWO38_6568 [Gemmataceae bacterium]|nr:hypothetical protein [Gemmataceae bacterium]